jgi:hypothetical protein
MSRTFFTNALLIVLIITLVAPTVFFIAPQKASASSLSCIGGLLGIGGSAATGATAVPVTNLSIQNATVSSAGSTGSSCINDVILIPLARMAIRALLQQMTASVINWINGSNGTGQPSYVQNTQAHFQGVGDSQANAFFAQFAASIASPFAAAIASSLRANYLQNTSGAGFWAANQCTLPKNLDDFLFGNWSQGGVAAWFALTTQIQNNPYTLYQASEAHLSDLIGPGIGGAIGARAAELAWGSGFLSWCGAAGTSYTPGTPGANGSGVSPGDPCHDSNGNPGTIKTPGSVVHGYVQTAVVNSPFAQLISANDIDNSFDAIVSALLGQVLGGVGGLFGASSPSYSNGSSGSRPPITTQLQTYSSSNSTATQSASQTAQSVSTQISTFTNAWQTINATASAASSTVTSLANFCTAAADTAALALLNSPATPANAPWAISGAMADLNSIHSVFIDASRAQAVAAQTAIITEIAPLPVQAQAAINAVSATQALALQVQSEASSKPPASGLASDIAVLSAMPPSITDVANAQQNAQVLGGAKASPAGSLTVSGGSLVDQLNLISSNAATLKTTVCNPASSLYVTSTGSIRN